MNNHPPDMTDEELREEYIDLLKNSKRAWGGLWLDAFARLLNGTDYSKAVVAEMRKRKLPGYKHEDGNYSYLCGSHFCRCRS